MKSFAFLVICLAPSRSAAAITPEEVLSIRELSNLQLSPDGSRVAFVVTEPPDGRSSIWVAAVASSPRWSPDGDTLAYLVDGPVGFARLWIVNVADGKTAQLTHDDFEISEMIWSPDGRELTLVVTPSSKPEDGDRASLIIIDRATGKIARTVTPHIAFAGALRWSPDGRLLTMDLRCRHALGAQAHRLQSADPLLDPRRTVSMA